MSKIAEIKALEEYPKAPSPYYGDEQDRNLKYRFGFIKGYDQAIQDFMEKACKWFESNLIDKEIVSMGIWHKFTDKDIEQFKNYMQDEIQD